MSGPKFVLDTNVVIGFLAGVDWAVRFIKDVAFMDAEVFISAITRMELLGFPGITPDEESRINQFLSIVTKIEITPDIEDTAISIRRTSRLKLPDAIVSAAAICGDATLVSADTDFERVKDLQLINPSA